MTKLYLRRCPSEEWNSSLAVRVSPRKEDWSDMSTFCMELDELQKVRIPLGQFKIKAEDIDDESTTIFWMEMFKSKPKPKDGYTTKPMYLTYSDDYAGWRLSVKPLKIEKDEADGWPEEEVTNWEDCVMKDDFLLCSGEIENTIGLKKPSESSKARGSHEIWVRWRKGKLPIAKARVE